MKNATFTSNAVGMFGMFTVVPPKLMNLSRISMFIEVHWTD